MRGDVGSRPSKTTILPQQMYFMLIHRGPTTVIPSKADFFSGSEWHPFFKKSLWAGTPKQNNKMFWIVSSRPSKGGDDDDDDDRSNVRCPQHETHDSCTDGGITASL